MGLQGLFSYAVKIIRSSTVYIVTLHNAFVGRSIQEPSVVPPSKRIAGRFCRRGDDSVSVATAAVARRTTRTQSDRLPPGRRLSLVRLSRPRKTNYSASYTRKSFSDSFSLGNQLNKNTRQINGKRPASPLIIKRLCYGTPTVTKIRR